MEKRITLLKKFLVVNKETTRARKTKIEKNPFEGIGTEALPYLLKSEHDLVKMAWLINQGIRPFSESGIHWQLVDDIHLTRFQSGKGWTPIGSYQDNKPFQGYFHGNGKVISNVYINNPLADYQGFFGFVKGGRIEELGVIDCNITGDKCTGVIAGRVMMAAIFRSFSTGKLFGSSCVAGGIVGEIKKAFLSDCYSKANVIIGTH